MITEKMTRLAEQLNRYGFVVDRKANKIQIKQAVETMYGVNVKDVKTMVNPAKARQRFTKQGVAKGKTTVSKRAIVTLAEGETIDFYSNI